MYLDEIESFVVDHIYNWVCLSNKILLKFINKFVLKLKQINLKYVSISPNFKLINYTWPQLGTSVLFVCYISSPRGRRWNILLCFCFQYPCSIFLSLYLCSMAVAFVQTYICSVMSYVSVTRHIRIWDRALGLHYLAQNFVQLMVPCNYFTWHVSYSSDI